MLKNHPARLKILTILSIIISLFILYWPSLHEHVKRSALRFNDDECQHISPFLRELTEQPRIRLSAFRIDGLACWLPVCEACRDQSRVEHLVARAGELEIVRGHHDRDARRVELPGGEMATITSVEKLSPDIHEWIRG